MRPQDSHSSSSSMIRYQTDDEGVVSQPEYTLTKPSNGPNDRDHLIERGIQVDEIDRRIVPTAHPIQTVTITEGVLRRRGHDRSVGNTCRQAQTERQAQPAPDPRSSERVAIETPPATDARCSTCGTAQESDSWCSATTTTTPKRGTTPASTACTSRPCAPRTHRWASAICRSAESRQGQSTSTATSTRPKRRAGATATCPSRTDYAQGGLTWVLERMRRLNADEQPGAQSTNVP